MTLLELMIVVAIIGLLVSLAVPNMVKARTVTQQNACICNLRQMDGAKQEWGMETETDLTNVPSWSNIQIYIFTGGSTNTPLCPADMAQTFATSYSLRDLNNPPVCKISPQTHILQ
jgi:prepilin-type N-terminal cleavage/methylation domain-containing protein